MIPTLDTGYRVAARRRTLRTLAASQIVAGVGIAGLGTAGALLVYDITGDEALSGLAQTFSVTGAALMAVPLARLTARGGRRLAIGSGYGLASLGALLAVVGGTQRWLTLILFGTMLAGAGTAAGYQLRFAAVDLSLPEHRGRDLAMVLWAGTVGSVLGPNLLEWSGGRALAMGLPKLVGPYLFAGASVFLALLILLVFLRPDPYLLSVQLAGRSKPDEHRSLRHGLHLIRASKPASLALAATVIGHIAMVSIMVMTPVHMKHVDASLRIIGLVVSVHILGMYLLSPVMGWAADRWGRVAVIRLGVLLLMASALTAGTAPAGNVPQLGVGLFLLGLGWSATMVAGSTMLAESMPVEERPSVQGTSDLFMNGAAAVGGAIAGVIIAQLSYAALCSIAMVPVLFLGIASLRFRSALEPAPHHP